MRLNNNKHEARKINKRKYARRENKADAKKTNGRIKKRRRRTGRATRKW